VSDQTNNDFFRHAWSFSRLSNRENRNTSYSIQIAWWDFRVYKQVMPGMAFSDCWKAYITRNTSIKFWSYSLNTKEFALRNSELMIPNSCIGQRLDSSSILTFGHIPQDRTFSRSLSSSNYSLNWRHMVFRISSVFSNHLRIVVDVRADWSVRRSFVTWSFLICHQTPPWWIFFTSSGT
jgi:hypothetical protein